MMGVNLKAEGPNGFFFRLPPGSALFRLPMLRFFFPIVALLSATALLGRGDIITLKSGEKIDGRILSETSAELKIEVKSGGIVDERTVAKSDVAKVEKASADGVAWQPLKTLQPGANSLPAGQYDRVIGPLRSFVTQFPQSPHAADAQKALTAFEEEKKRVDSGELKLSGKWISKEEVQKERYQINALVALNHLREQQARGDVIGALNTFDVIERDYPGSRAYPDAVEAVLRILPAVKAQAAARMAALPAEKETQEKAIAAALEPSKSEMKAAGERERAMNEQLVAAAKTQGANWPPFLPKSEEAMRMIADRATNEGTRLAGLNIGNFRQSIQLAEKARQSLAAKELQAAEETLNQAQALWDANELVKRTSAELASARTASTEPLPAEPPPPADPGSADPAAAPTSTATGTSESSSPEQAVSVSDAEPEDEASLITPFRLVLAIVVIAFLVALWKMYKSVKSKANEVLE